MSIGDSLAQGCRSLTVKESFCEQSWPARVAEAQKWEFVTPDFPRPVLFDLEEEIRRLDTLSISIERTTCIRAVRRVRQLKSPRSRLRAQIPRSHSGRLATSI
jgi:hypothetical protein